MKEEFILALSFDDVLIAPNYSTIKTRKLIKLETDFSRNIKLKNPIVSANMDTVTESRMAIAMARAGGLGVIHRFLPLEKQAREVGRVKGKNNNGHGKLLVAAAIGVKDGENQADVLIKKGADALVIDIAHGHHQTVIKLLKILKKKYGDKTDLVVGNVATKEATEDLIKAGADAVKVGIGPGRACSTRVVAGAGVPQFTAVRECVRIARRHKVPIIADGGIRNSGDLAKIIGAGASTTMIGSLLAGTVESPGKYFVDGGAAFKMYRGLASLGASLDRMSLEGKSYRQERAAEGISTRVPLRGDASAVIKMLLDGLQSGMSYSGANSIKEFWRKVQFIRITESGLKEGKPKA